MRPLLFFWFTWFVELVTFGFATPPFDHCLCRNNVLDCSSRTPLHHYAYRRPVNETQNNLHNIIEPENNNKSIYNEVPHIDVQSLCPNATEVHLQSLELRQFPDGLQNVTKIDVSSNRMTVLPDPSLLGRNTKYLDLSNNELANATEQLRSLSALEELRIGWNRLSHLRFLPSPCALRRLDARVNFFTGVEGPLRQCWQMRTLFLFATNITELPDDAFSGMVQLRELLLSGNPITTLSEKAFAGLLELEILDLRDALLRTLPARGFMELQKLQSLKLHENLFETLPEQTFFGLVDLRSLYLSKALRNVSNLPESLFSPLTKLRELYLNDNGLISLPNNLFQQLELLQDLHLENNELQSIPEQAFASLRNLNVLRLDRNKLVSLPKNLFQRLHKLRDLNLENNKLQLIPEGAFASTRNLKTLRLNSNDLVSLPHNIFQRLEQLEDLHLENNKLQVIPEHSFAFLGNLKTLHLDQNKLRVLPFFSNLSSLQEVDASSNSLTVLPEMGDCCASLTTASFSNNSVALLSESTVRALLGDGGRRFVDLHGNPIRSSALRWLLRATDARTYVSDRDCKCGGMSLRGSYVNFCVDVPCGSDSIFPNWVAAIRGANAR